MLPAEHSTKQREPAATESFAQVRLPATHEDAGEAPGSTADSGGEIPAGLTTRRRRRNDLESGKSVTANLDNGKERGWWFDVAAAIIIFLVYVIKAVVWRFPVACRAYIVELWEAEDPMLMYDAKWTKWSLKTYRRLVLAWWLLETAMTYWHVVWLSGSWLQWQWLYRRGPMCFTAITAGIVGTFWVSLCVMVMVERSQGGEDWKKLGGWYRPHFFRAILRAIVAAVALHKAVPGVTELVNEIKVEMTRSL